MKSRSTLGRMFPFTTACALVVPAVLGVGPALAAEALAIEVETAPIVPNGLVAGEPFDVTLTFVDRDPAVPGIPMKAGGTATVLLPREIVNTGSPVAKVMGVESCQPPVLADCSTAGFLNGWPQSPMLPFNEVEYDGDAHALVLTAAADAPPYSVEHPGLKLIHLITLGFRNPAEPGDLELALEIRPDPASDEVLSGTATLPITAERAPVVTIDSTGNPPTQGPRRPNTMYQSVPLGGTSSVLGFNLWNAEHDALVGAAPRMDAPGEGRLVGADGTVLGTVTIDAPDGAKAFGLLSAPSMPAKTGLAGFPTGRLRGVLHTDPGVPGDYTVTVALDGGNAASQRVTAQP